ncbi:MAG: TatD family hydrolase [Candidatus Aminicenantes bacterium]|nr:TatD family hydrolase [Candidatus Aminicenantes bacterium]
MSKKEAFAKFELVDSHTHLDDRQFAADRLQVLERAREKGISSFLCPLDLCLESSLDTGLKLASEQPGIYLAAGVHPHQAKALKTEHLSTIRQLAEEKKILAVGEIGLDFHYNFSPSEKQRLAFEYQLDLAVELKLPVIIHSRLAGSQILELLRVRKGRLRGIFHCFTETYEVAHQALDLGFIISFSGIITYQRADELREVAKKIPLENLLVETDAPYLTPWPEKKVYTRNEPALVLTTARMLASLKNVSLEELAQKTTENFFRFFRLKKD